MPSEPLLLAREALGQLGQLEQWIEHYELRLRATEQGVVSSVGDGIAWISGLPSAAIDEILLFQDGSRGVVYHLGESSVGAIMLQQTQQLAAGCKVHLSKRQMSIATGDTLLGRVINPLGEVLDGGEAPRDTQHRPLDTRSPGIVERDFVHDPLYMGSKIIDTLIPVGRGQRQLIIGDDGLGRSSLAMDAIINQRGRDVYCVYVMIGQRRSSVVSTLNALKHFGAIDYTTVVVSEASALPGLSYIAPFAGCAIAEAWMYRGKDVLIVYDDLSTHAHAYRELSLLLRRPPGREAYPGDIVFLHSRLLERATCLNASCGGGSITALPIVETQLGEIASYIPTNLISITDGQIYLSQALFQGGFRPSIDISKSVSRIGGKAQPEAIKNEASRMKLDYLQFLELEVFTRFGARPETGLQKKLQRGRILRELLKQDRLKPVSECFNLGWLIGFNEDLFDGKPLEELQSCMDALQEQIAASALGLDSPRKEWIEQLEAWLGIPGSG